MSLRLAQKTHEKDTLTNHFESQKIIGFRNSCQSQTVIQQGLSKTDVENSGSRK